MLPVFILVVFVGGAILGLLYLITPVAKSKSVAMKSTAVYHYGSEGCNGC